MQNVAVVKLECANEGGLIFVIQVEWVAIASFCFSGFCWIDILFDQNGLESRVLDYSIVYLVDKQQHSIQDSKRNPNYALFDDNKA